MKLKLAILFSLSFVFNSCKNDTEGRIIETQKDVQKKEIIFSNINKAWMFNTTPMNPTSKAYSLSWKEWRDFLFELDQKPKKTIGAFQKKSSEISKKVMILDNHVPAEFNVPPIKSRIATLITKVRMLDLLIHLKEIPDQNVVILITEINVELASLQNQMHRIVQKSKIQLEEGELDLLRMLDTTRLIQNVKQDPNLPSVE